MDAVKSDKYPYKLEGQFISNGILMCSDDYQKHQNLPSNEDRMIKLTHLYIIQLLLEFDIGNIHRAVLL